MMECVPWSLAGPQDALKKDSRGIVRGVYPDRGISGGCNTMILVRKTDVAGKVRNRLEGSRRDRPRSERLRTWCQEDLLEEITIAWAHSIRVHVDYRDCDRSKVLIL